VIPADDKPFMRLAVAATVVLAVEELQPAFPELDEHRRGELEEARRRLLREGGKR
jgi:hypothetical protein